MTRARWPGCAACRNHSVNQQRCTIRCFNRSDDMKGLLVAAGLVLCAAPAFAQCPADEHSESEWAALSEDQKATCMASNPELLEKMATLICASTMSTAQCYSAIHEALNYNMP